MYYNITTYIIKKVRPEYDVKLHQGARTVRVLLHKYRYVAHPGQWWPHRNNRTYNSTYMANIRMVGFLPAVAFFPHTLGHIMLRFVTIEMAIPESGICGYYGIV